jgi:hypothetical protein
MNKTGLYCLSILLLAIGVSCKKKVLYKLTEFDLSYSTILSIPTASMAVSNPSATPNTIEFFTPNISSQHSKNLSEQNTAQSLVDKILMSRFNVSAVSSGTHTANFNYLSSIKVYIKASGLTETLVAEKAVIPNGISSLSLDLHETDLKSFILKDKFQFRIATTFDSTTATNQTLKMDETVHVTAKLLK